MMKNAKIKLSYECCCCRCSGFTTAVCATGGLLLGSGCTGESTAQQTAETEQFVALCMLSLALQAGP